MASDKSNSTRRGRKVDYATELAAVRDVDWARLAAFLDGEGNLRLNADDIKTCRQGKRRMTRYRCILRITNTDVRLTEWCQRTFGGSIMFRESGSLKWKDSTTWYTCDGRTEYILRNCLPYFVIKREQAEIMLAFRATYKFRNSAEGGLRDAVNGRLVSIDPAVHNARRALADQLKQLTRRGRTDVMETIQ